VLWIKSSGRPRARVSVGRFDRFRARVTELLSDAVFGAPTVLLILGLLIELGAPVTQVLKRSLQACIAVPRLTHHEMPFKREANTAAVSLDA
jgi:hypothetical protein